MTIPLQIKSGTVRNYPQNKDKNYGVEATAWASDVTAAINAAPTTNKVFQVDYILGSAAQVTAGLATHSSLAAIQGVASGGEVVFVLAGVYNYSSQLDITKRLHIINQSFECSHRSAAGLAGTSIIKFSQDYSTWHGGSFVASAGTPTHAIEINAYSLYIDTVDGGGFSVGSVLNTLPDIGNVITIRDGSGSAILGPRIGLGSNAAQDLQQLYGNDGDGTAGDNSAGIRCHNGIMQMKDRAGNWIDLSDITGANVNLDNLDSVTMAINTSLISDTNMTDNLGSDPIEWQTVYAQKISHGDAGTPDLDIETTSDNGDINLTPHGTGATKATNIDVIGGTIGNVTPVTIAKVDNIQIDSNTISSLDANGNINLTPNGSGSVIPTNMSRPITDSITAHSGGGQAAAVALTTDINRVTVCAALGDSVRLPATFPAGYEITIINDGAYSCDIFPSSGDYIDSLAVDTAFRLSPNCRTTFISTTANSNWRVKSIYGANAYDSITAHSGGGQASAVELIKGLNIITTCAAQLDSVKTPSSIVAGDAFIVVNNGAKVANVYPASGHNFNGLAADTPIPLMPGNTLQLFAHSTSNLVTLEEGWQESNELDIATSGDGTGYATVESKVIFKYKNGVWKASLLGACTNTSASRSSQTLTFTGIVFKNVTNKYQTGSSWGNGWNGVIASDVQVNTNASTAKIEHATATTTGYSWNIPEVTLNAMPTIV